MNFSSKFIMALMTLFLVPLLTNAQSRSFASITACPAEPVDLCIFDGLYDWVSGTSYSGGQVVVDEMTRGAITVANKNDTDGDNIEDRSPTDLQVIPNPSIPLGRNEIDLIKITIHKPMTVIAGVDATVKLTNGAGRVLFWLGADKTGSIAALNNAPNVLTISPSTLPKDIYMEILDPSMTVRDITLRMDYNGGFDEVAATGVWVEPTRVWLTRDTCISCPENPQPGGIGPDDLPDANEPDLIFQVKRFKAKDWSRYGYGSCQFDIGGTNKDRQFSGRILHQFSVIPDPNLLSGFNLNFDVTRQKAIIAYKMPNKKNVIIPIDTTRFPYDVLLDNEQANDDLSTNDEDSTPNLKLFSFDAPGIDILAPWGFYIEKSSFNEYVRVKINSPFPPGYNTTSDPSTNTQNVVDGSRVSAKVEWSNVKYLKRGSDGNFEEDNTPISYSYPRFLSSTGSSLPGSCNVSLLPGAVNRGYWLIFNQTTSEWSLFHQTSAVSTASPVPGSVPRQWQIQESGMANITIIEDNSRPFTNNDIYYINVFLSNNKKNFIQLGSYPVFDPY